MPSNSALLEDFIAFPTKDVAFSMLLFLAKNLS